MFGIIFSVVKIFYANIENNSCDKSIIQAFNPVRADYVESFTDYGRKKQSLWVWKLLEYALIKVYGNCDFDFEFNGSFFSIVDHPEIKFSLSHSKNVVAVAISNNSVGVDVEVCDKKVLNLKKSLGFEDYYTKTEKDLIEKLTLEWTKKESLFKAKGGKNYRYLKYNDEKFDYFITVCCDCNEVEFIKVDL